MAVNRIPTDMIIDRASGQKLSAQLVDIANRNLPVFNVTGAKYGGGNGKDITNAIVLAQADATAVGGGIIYIPEGTYSFTHINLTSRSPIIGAGKDATKLLYLNNLNANAITLKDDTVVKTGMRNLTIDGNKANNTSGHMIYINKATIPNGVDFDSHLAFSDLEIKNGADCGMYINLNSREGRYERIIIHDCNGYGIFHSASDNFFHSVTCYANGKSGIFDQGGAVHWNECKTFLNNKNGDVNDGGFYIKSGRRYYYVNCEAQENYGRGFVIDNAKNVQLIGCAADANNSPLPDALAQGDGSGVGFEIKNACQGVTIVGTVSDSHVSNYGTQCQFTGIKADVNSTGIMVILTTQDQPTKVASGYRPNNATFIIDGVLYGKPYLKADGTDDAFR